MNTSNLGRQKCFRFQVKECQNAFIETWIRVAKFSERIPIRSDDTDKRQTKFLLSAIFPRSGMHTPHLILAPNFNSIWNF